MANNSRILRLFGVNILVDQVADERDDQDQKDAEFCTVDALSVVDVDNDSNTAPSTISDSTVYNPTPLRCFRPDDDVQKTNSRKRKQDNVNGGARKKRLTKRARADKNSTTPRLPLEEIPALMKQVEERNGTEVVFLYGKELEESDILKEENRLFINKREKFEELFSLANLKLGMDVEGIDGKGYSYKLGLVIWNSVKKLVVKKEWRKLVENNGAKKGDWVQVWSFRVGEERKTCLAVHFVKPNNSASGSSAGN